MSLPTELTHLVQHQALRDLAMGYKALRDEPRPPEDTQDLANALAETLAGIDPERCLGLVVLSVQRPDPERLVSGENPEDNFQHTILSYGYAELIENLLCERLAGVKLECAKTKEAGGDRFDVPCLVEGPDVHRTPILPPKEH